MALVYAPEGVRCEILANLKSVQEEHSLWRDLDSPPRTVLVVDDEPLIRIELADLLSDMGYTVLEAATPAAAIVLLEAHPEISAVITDMNMPGDMDGIALAHVVRKRWPPCALIMVSGQLRPADGELPLGMRFLSKPVGARSLQRTLGDLGVGLH